MLLLISSHKTGLLCIAGSRYQPMKFDAMCTTARRMVSQQCRLMKESLEMVSSLSALRTERPRAPSHCWTNGQWPDVPNRKGLLLAFFFPVLSCNFQHVSITRLDTPRNILGHVKLLVLYAPAFSGSAVCTTDFAIEHRETALGKGLKLVCYRESTNWDEAGGICQRKTFLLLGLLMGSAIRFEDVDWIFALLCSVPTFSI